jgi:hypothetical protein
MRYAYMSLLAGLTASCGPHPRNELPVDEASVQRVVQAFEQVAGARVVEFELHVVQRQGDLSIGQTCACIAFTDYKERGSADYPYVEIALVDMLAWTPLVASTLEPGRMYDRTPLTHELVHIVYGDDNHERPDLWSPPDGRVYEVYDLLNGTSH